MQRRKRDFSRLGATSSQNKLPATKDLASLSICLSASQVEHLTCRGPFHLSPTGQGASPGRALPLFLTKLNVFLSFLSSSLPFFLSHPHNTPTEYSSMVFSVQSCTTITIINFRIFLAPLKEPPNFSQSSPMTSKCSPHPSPRQPLTYFLCPQVCLFWTFRTHGIT